MHNHAMKQARFAGSSEFGGFPGAGGFGRGGMSRGGPGGGGHGGRGPGGGRGRRGIFDANDLKLILLGLIAEQPRHGYDLIRAIEDKSGGAYVPSPSMIYPKLTMLADMGFADEHADTASGRKLFGITAEGAGHLEEHRNALLDAMGRLDILAKRALRTDGAPIRRAMENLKMALFHRLEKEGADNDTMFDVAAIIDEAAGKIERLK